MELIKTSPYARYFGPCYDNHKLTGYNRSFGLWYWTILYW